MRAQSLRKAVSLLDAALVVGLVGAIGWYFWQVRPRLAEAGKPAPWLETAYKQYEQERRNITPASIHPLRGEEELREITDPEHTRGRGVWPYVGPVPPAPLPPKAAVEAPPPPKGLDAIGKPYMFWFPEILVWDFGSGKARGRFRRGDWIRESEQEKGRFRLVDMKRADGDEAVFTVVYDVYDDPAKDPVSRETSPPYDMRVKPKFGSHIHPVTAADPAGTGTAGTGTPPGAAVAGPVARTEFKPYVARTQAGNHVGISFDDVRTWRYVSQDNVDQLLSDVKTEEVRDASGRPSGIRVSGLGAASVANEFGVQAGDILKSINGRATHSRAEAIDIAKGMPKDTASVVVVIERAGRDITYQVDPRDPAVRSAAGKARFEK